MVKYENEAICRGTDFEMRLNIKNTECIRKFNLIYLIYSRINYPNWLREKCYQLLAR